MTPTLFLRDAIAFYASRLIGLGQPTGSKTNFLFGPPLEFSDVLENAIRSSAVFPAIVLEYPDNQVDDNNRTGLVETLPVALTVVASVSVRNNTFEERDELIYATCKPLADQILARLQRESDARLLKQACNFEIQLQRAYNGSWVGPVISGVYGYRYTLDFRVFGTLKFDQNQWSD